MMPRVRLLLALLASVLATTLTARATSPADEKAPEESLTRWKYYLDVELPPKGPSGLYDFIVPPVVLDHSNNDSGMPVNDRFGRPGSMVKEEKERWPRTMPAKDEKVMDFSGQAAFGREGLNDLRLLDADGKPVPHALRVRRSVNIQQPVPVGQFNPTTNPEHQAQVRLDLGTDARDNAIEVRTSGSNFRRKVLVEGSDDNKTWVKILDNELLFFQAEGQLLQQRRFDYPPSRWRYLRVTVSPDVGKIKDEPRLEEVIVYHSVQVPSLDEVHQADVGKRQSVPTDLGRGSMWTIEFGGLRVPCDRLRIDAAETSFSRLYKVQLEIRKGEYQELAQGEWKRKTGETSKPLEVKFPNEVNARHLRLVVIDGRDPPLTLKEVSYIAPAREVIFPALEGIKGPLKLYYDNPAAAEPRSDFAATLAANIEPPPTRIDLDKAKAHENPAYLAPEKPWTDRYPWLVYVVLGTASVVLLIVIGLLASQALKRTPPLSAPVS